MFELAKKVYLFIFVAFNVKSYFVHNGAGGHFGFLPVEKMPGFLRGTLGLNIFYKVQGSQINHQNILVRKWS